MIRSFAGMMVLAFLVICACDDTGTGAQTVTLSEFRLAAQIAGWSESVAEGYVEYDTTDLYTYIDGGAIPYIKTGMENGIRQKLVGPDSVRLDALVMDFGSEAEARAMYQLKLDNYQIRLPIGSYAESTAFGYQFLNGASVFAYFGRYYCDLTFIQYREPGQAVVDAAAFISFYEGVKP